MQHIWILRCFLLQGNTGPPGPPGDSMEVPPIQPQADQAAVRKRKRNRRKRRRRSTEPQDIDDDLMNVRTKLFAKQENGVEIAVRTLLSLFIV